MVWVFASVVLVLAVLSEGFRKAAYVCLVSGVLIAFTVLCFSR